MIDASESQVFIAVYHDSNTTNLYISDETGTSYSLSLEYIVGPDLSSWAVSNPKFDVYVVSIISESKHQSVNVYFHTIPFFTDALCISLY